MEPAHQSIERPHTDEQMIQIQHATEGYKARHPEASLDDIATFQATVEANIRRKQTRPRVSKEERKARRAAVAARMKELGLRTTSIRRAKYHSFTFEGKRVEIPGDILPTGGTTVVYKLSDGQITIAASLCSNKDNFDSVAGRERAIDRFLKGLTVTLPGDDITEVDPRKFRKAYEKLLWKRKAAA